MGFKDLLTGKIPDHLLDGLPARYDVIGSVAVLSIPEILREYRFGIADALIAHRSSIRTVLNKIGSVGGPGRIARYEVLVGSDTITTYREYGFSYRFDVLTTFFNPRLQTERKRVTGLVRPGEQVLVPFAGVGPFVIPAAARGGYVVAVEQNREALRWLVENSVSNGVANRVTAVLGDAFDPTLLPHQSFDRLIVPTPYGMDAILEVLGSCVRPGGLVHFYTFKPKEEAEEFRRELEIRGYVVACVRRCGNVAPGIARWVYDLVKRESS